MKTFHKIETLPDGRKHAVFRVATDRGDQFLCSDTESEDFSVVEVDADHFLELWRNDTYEPHRAVAQGNPETWIKCPKLMFIDPDTATKHIANLHIVGFCSLLVELADVHHT